METNKPYIELTLYIDSIYFDEAVAWLTDAGFESFTEEETCLKAYILKEYFNEILPHQVSGLLIPEKPPLIQEIQPQNWNEEWEHSFSPVRIGDKIRVRATFHEPDSNYIYDLLIQPKMSFGTGHHETTALMMEAMLCIDLTGKEILDFGCGSGILSILAEKAGAKKIWAIDNDDWALTNVPENIALNHCHNIDFQKGSIEEVNHENFDIILANINRNILMENMERMSDKLSEGDLVLMSGFYSSDVPEISQEASRFGIKIISENSAQRDWMCILGQKKSLK